MEWRETLQAKPTDCTDVVNQKMFTDALPPPSVLTSDSATDNVYKRGEPTAIASPRSWVPRASLEKKQLNLVASGAVHEDAILAGAVPLHSVLVRYAPGRKRSVSRRPADPSAETMRHVRLST